MKKVLSFVVSCAMVLGMVPAPALAEAIEEVETVTQSGDGIVAGETSTPQSEPEQDAEPEQDVEPAQDVSVQGTAAQPPAESEIEQAAEQQTKADEAQGEADISTQSDEADVSTQESAISIVDVDTETEATSLHTAHAYRLQGNNLAELANGGTLLRFTRTSDLKPFYPILTVRDGNVYLDGLYQREDYSNGYGDVSMAIPSGTYRLSFGDYASDGTVKVTSDGNLKLVSSAYVDNDVLCGLFMANAHDENKTDDQYDLDNTLDTVDATTDLHAFARIDGSSQYKSLTTDQSVQLERIELYPCSHTLSEVKAQLAADESSTAHMPTLANFDPEKCVVAWDRTTDAALTTSFPTDDGTLLDLVINKFNFANAAIESGTYHPVVVLSVDDNNGTSYECRYVYDPMQINASYTRTNPKITTSELSQGLVGSTYSAQLAGRRGALSTSTLTWSLAEGSSLPAGLELSDAGVISGTPTAAETYTFTVKLSETLDGETKTAEKELTITVADEIELGDISYPKQYWSTQQNNLVLSTPINVDLPNAGYGDSVAFYTVVSRRLDGTLDTKLNQHSATIGSSTITVATPIAEDVFDKNPIVAIERIDLTVWVYKDGEAESEPLQALTATADTSDLVLGGYARFPQLRWTDDDGVEQGLSTEWPISKAEVSVWPVDSSGTATGDATTATITDDNNARLALAPGTYRFTVLGAAQDPTDTTADVAWIDITNDSTATAVYGGTSTNPTLMDPEWVDADNTYGSLVRATKVVGTKPIEYELVVEPTRTSDVTFEYAEPAVDQYSAQASFADGTYTSYGSYEVTWTGTREGSEVLIGTGDSVCIPIDVYTDVKATATPKSDYAARFDAVTKTVNTTTKTVALVMPLKATFTVSGTVSCTNASESWYPEATSKRAWGSIHIQRPTGTGEYDSNTVWLAKTDGDEAGATSKAFTIEDVTPGTKLTYYAPVASGCGTATYTVADDASSDVTGVTLNATTAAGTVEFESGSLVYQAANSYATTSDDEAANRTTDIVLNDGLTSIKVYEGGTAATTKVEVPFTVVDSTTLTIHDDAAKLVNGTTYDIVVTRRERDTACPFYNYPQTSAQATCTVTLGEGGKATLTSASPTTLVSLGRVLVPYKYDALLSTAYAVLALYDSEGTHMAKCVKLGVGGVFSTPFLEAGTYTLYAVDSKAFPYILGDYATASSLEAAITDTSKYTKVSLTVEDNKITKLGDTFNFPTSTAGGTADLVDADYSYVGATSTYAGYTSITVNATLNGDALSFDADKGDEVWLEIHTNQKSSDSSSGYTHLQALKVNGKAVDYNRWNSGKWGTEEDMFNRTAPMADGDLSIKLSHEKIGCGSNSSFPLSATITVPRTDYMETNATARLRVRKKQSDGSYAEHRALIGSFAEQHESISLAVPYVTNTTSFMVHGNTSANAAVGVYLDGAQVATATADEYGVWSARVDLPSDVASGDYFEIQALADWMSAGAKHSGTSETMTTTYSAERGAVKRIWMLWQDVPEGPYKYTLIYNNGELPAEYQTFYRAWNESTNTTNKHPYFTWMVEFANASRVKNVRVVLPRSTGDLELETSQDATQVADWFPAKTYRAQVGGPLSLGFMYKTYDYYALIQEQLKAGNTFVANPTYLGYSPAGVTVDYDEVVPKDTIAADKRYTGFVDQSETYVKQYLESINAYNNKMKFATRGEQNDNVTWNYKLLKPEDYAKSLVEHPDVDHYLLLSNDNAESFASDGTVNTSKSWLPIQFSIKAEDGDGGYADLVSEAETAEDTFYDYLGGLKDENLSYDGIVSADDKPTYKGNKIVCIATSESAQDPSVVYFVWTQDAFGNTYLYSMNRTSIDGTSDKYVYNLIEMSPTQLKITRWNEKPASGDPQKLTRTFTLPEEMRSAAAQDYVNTLDLWDVVLTMVNEGAEETVTQYDSHDDEDVSGLQNSTVHGQLTAQSWHGTGNVVLDNTIVPVAYGFDETAKYIGNAIKEGNDRHLEYAITQEYLRESCKCDGAYLEGYAKAKNGQKSAWGEAAAQNLRYMTDGLLSTIYQGVEASASGPGELALSTGASLFFDSATQRWREKVIQKNGKTKVRDIKLEDFSPEFQAAIEALADEHEEAKKWGLPTPEPNKTMKSLFDQARKKKAARAAAAKNPKMRLDPSGFIYEAVLTNRVEGATVKLYTHNAAGNPDDDYATFVNASTFNYEENPQVTKEDGRYQWYVGSGYWQVHVSKVGYASVSTGDSADYGIGATKDLDGDGTDDAKTYWMPVLPEQIDVNIGLVSTESPKIESFAADETGATVVFTKYVKSEAVTKDMFTLDGKEPEVMTATDEEEAGNGSGVMLARTFRLTYADGAIVDSGAEVAVAFNDAAGKVTSYADVAVAETDRTYAATSAAVSSRVDVASAKVTLASTKLTYTGKALTPAVKSVVLDDATLEADTDYAVTYANNTNVGAATVTVTGKGNYKGMATAKFTIVRAASSIKLAAQTKTYTGKALAYSGKVTKSGSAGKVTYAYYSDAACKKAVAASKVVGARTYYVRATLAADARYNAATSAAAKFIVAKATKAMTIGTVVREALLKTVKKKKTVVACPLAVTDAVGTLTYAKIGGAKQLTVNKKSGKVTVQKGTKKGAFKVKIKVTAAGNANYNAQSKVVTCTVKVVPKLTNTLTLTAVQRVAKLAKVKKKAVTVARPFKVSKAKGTVSYKKAGGAKQLTVNKKTGKVTVKKGAKAGTYTVKIKATAKGNADYKKGTKTIVCTVVVK